MKLRTKWSTIRLADDCSHSAATDNVDVDMPDGIGNAEGHGTF